ncbi:dihydrofolate reductase, partial [Escherichia coli]
MKVSLMAAKAKNGVIGCGPDIPWSAKGEQLLFKALTYNQWLLVGRKTFESMGALPNRKYGTVAKLAMRQPFVLFKGLTFQKLCLPGAFRPGDHHNKMLRPGLC